jgi:ABC-type transport system substrate-binding protein
MPDRTARTGPFLGRGRAALPALTLLAALLAGLSLAGDPAPAKPGPKPGRDEQEEDSPNKPVRVVPVEGDDNEAKAAPVDLAEAAKKETNPAVKKLFNDYARPHDVVTLRTNNKLRIEPIGQYVGDKPEVLDAATELKPYAAGSWKLDPPLTPEKKKGFKSIQPYELVVLTAEDDFVKHDYSTSSDSQLRLSPYQQHLAAEQVLKAALLFHDSNRQGPNGVRRGDDWEPVGKQLRQRLLEVLLSQLTDLTADGNWEGAFALAGRLAKTYPAAADQERIAEPLAALVQRTMGELAIDDAKKREAVRRLRQLEDRFPDSRAVKPVAEALHKQADDLFKRAKKIYDERPDDREVDALLQRVRETWPGMPELRAFEDKRGKNHPTLRVGVRSPPKFISPGLACTDSDRRAVELVFESLVKLSPGEGGAASWRPALAEGRPKVLPLGREFRLPSEAIWSDRKRLTAADVRYTVEMLRKGKGTGLAPAWGDLLDDVRVGDHTLVPVTLQQGWMEPLALMQFKVLPSHADPAPNTPEFAGHPIGSGPFLYAGPATEPDGATFVKFTANPAYGARQGKSGQPYLQEIRFFAYKSTPAQDAAELRLNLLLDLTAAEAAEVKTKAGELHLKVPPAAANRRVWFLAVNHRNAALQSAPLRLALAYAIDRETILDRRFRAGAEHGARPHRALNGPYPAGSWPCDPKLTGRAENSLDPFDEAGARAMLKQAREEGAARDVTLSLKYPADDPAVEKAVKDICEQFKAILEIKVTPEALSPEALRRDVEGGRFDLAYCHYDFPDDVYWLGPLLGPRGGAGGENFMGYRGPLATMVQNAALLRNFAQAQEAARRIHQKFLQDEMPFIPLWQLDGYAAVGDDVTAPPFDPTTVFTDAESWRLGK